MKNDWMIDVIKDLKAYSEQERLSELRSKLQECEAILQGASAANETSPPRRVSN